jgi:hypothetical protein
MTGRPVAAPLGEAATETTATSNGPLGETLIQAAELGWKSVDARRIAALSLHI